MIKQPQLVTTPNEAERQIKEFSSNVGTFADYLPYFRSWYAMPIKDGWLLAPSIFAGYKITPTDYIAIAGQSDERDLDGRQTEAVLKRWSETIEEGHRIYEALYGKLVSLCARFGRRPNAKARISVIKPRGQTEADHESPDELVSLIAELYRRLAPARKTAFRRAVGID